jgi:hypothetical protein
VRRQLDVLLVADTRESSNLIGTRRGRTREQPARDDPGRKRASQFQTRTSR